MSMKQFFGRLVLYYLRFFAKLQLRKYAPDVIGITGSAGKSSAKQAVATILGNKYRLKVTGKANSESGIPLDILEIKPDDFSLLDWVRMMILAPMRLLFLWKPVEKYVVEMGIDAPNPPKNMEYLLSIIQPRTALFLNAYPVHSQAFDAVVPNRYPGNRTQAIIEAIAAEKGKLITALPKNGLAILNADQPEVAAFADKTAATVMFFGKKSGADVEFVEALYEKQGTRFEFRSSKESASVMLHSYLPDYVGMTLAAALCVNKDEGNSLAEGCDRLSKHYSMPPGRMSVFEGVNNSVIIDSSYNASAEPVVGALSMLKKLPAKRRLAILGDMRELGEETESETKRVVLFAREACDQLVLVGPIMKGFSMNADQWFATAAEAGEFVKSQLQPGDYVLVKGSQNTIFLEMAVEKLLEHKADAHKLCRRGAYWNDVRAKLLEKMKKAG